MSTCSTWIQFSSHQYLVCCHAPTAPEHGVFDIKHCLRSCKRFSVEAKDLLKSFAQLASFEDTINNTWPYLGTFRAGLLHVLFRNTYLRRPVQHRMTPGALLNEPTTCMLYISTGPLSILDFSPEVVNTICWSNVHCSGEIRGLRIT